MNYTLGPWKLVDKNANDNSLAIASVSPKEGPIVAYLPRCLMTNADIQANARLIANAPEMFESLQPTIRLLNMLLEREETMGRKGDTETADWIRTESIRLMRLENKIRGEE